MKYPVPNVVKQIVLGGLLGDAHIRQKEWNGNKCNAHLMMTHSSQQEDYLRWKNDLLGPYKGKVTYTGRQQYTVTTKSHQHMNPFMELVGKPKKVTRKWLNQLDALGLAVWYMDDGSLNLEYYKREDGTENIRRRRLILCTDGFSLEEHWIIQRYFKVVWDIEVGIHTYKSSKDKRPLHRITMNYTNAQKFVDIIGPYIIDSMKYKIDFNRQRVCHNVPTVTGDDIV